MLGIDLEQIIQTIGLIGLFAVIFAESGLLIGFFLPGDSLLFTAGFLASQGVFNIHVLALLCFIAAVTGDSVGYTFGKRFGPRIFKRDDSLLFHKDHLVKAQLFYEKHGGKTIILARFMPVIRTFAPIVAGAGNMEYKRFLMFNVVGGLIWGVGLPYAGYFLGKLIPPDMIDKVLLPVIALIIIVSVAPGLYHLLKDKSTRDKLIAAIKRDKVIVETSFDDTPKSS